MSVGGAGQGGGLDWSVVVLAMLNFTCQLDSYMEMLENTGLKFRGEA